MARPSLNRHLSALAGVTLAVATLASTSAIASEGYVTAHSRFGNGSVTAPVRDARNGEQVRLPGGSWVYCRKSCSETLRVETVDIFETNGSLTGYGTRMNECGIFGCLEIRYPR
jgi:hypothetical protein